MENGAAAFHSFPSEERGILLIKTFKPLSLHAADVHVRLTGYAATVTLSLEYVNETNKLARAIAAYPVPAPYQLQSTTLRGPTRSLTADVFESTRLLKAAEAGSALSTKPLVDTPVIAVATQAVPWEINPGESILMQAVYHVPIPAAHRTGEVVFTLPADLIPAVQRPAEVQRNYMTFLDARSRLRHLTQTGGTVRVCVEAQLFLPVRGGVTLEKGIVAVPGVGGSGVKVDVDYSGDARFSFSYHDDLPAMPYMQQALRVRIPVGETAEPVRLHSVAAPTPRTVVAEAGGGAAASDGATAVAAAMAVTIAPVLSKCPSNAEVVFVMDVHSAAQAAEAAVAIMGAIESLEGTANRVNVLVCRDLHQGGPVALLPEGAVPATEVPYHGMLAFMKEEGVQSRVGPAHPRASSPVSIDSAQLATVLHDAVAGRGIATAVPQGYVRNVIVVTDGGSQASDAAAVAMVCDAASNSRACRVHAVALTSTADRAVLETLAQTAGGCFASAVCAPGEEETGGEVDDAMAAVLEVAAVPCLVDLRTNWEVTPADGAADTAATPTPSSLTRSSLRPAACVDGRDIACIPQGTQRLLYGIFTTAPAQVDLHLCGRVGEMTLEYTASASIAPAQAADSDAPAAAAAGAGGGSPASAAPPPLVTAAAAARIDFLTHGLRATTEAEAKEVMALSRAYAVPSPFTLLTDGQCVGPGGEHKPGGIVRLPSTQTAVHVDTALRTRRTELHAAAALQRATRAV